MKIKRIRFMKIEQDCVGNDIRDMLRYDCAFISDAHPGIVAFPVFKTKHGDLGGPITVDRWRSFGVKFEPHDIDDAKAFELRDELSRDKWHTYRHVRDDASLLMNWSKLVKTDIDDFFSDAIFER